MATIDLIISKGSYSVTVYASSISDGLKDKLTPIPSAIAPQNQDVEATTATQTKKKLIDLLNVMRTIMIKGSILTSKDKSDLIKIQRGGGTKGGSITLTYSDGGDKTSITGYIDSLLFTQEPSDFGVGWLTGKDWKVGDVVEDVSELNGNYYKCKVSHTNGTTRPSDDGTNWDSFSINDFAKFTVSITFIEGVSVWT